MATSKSKPLSGGNEIEPIGKGAMKVAPPGRAVFKIDVRSKTDRREASDRREQLRLAEVRRTPKDRRKKTGWNGPDV